MQEHMRKPHTSSKANITWRGKHYRVPVSVLDQYKIDGSDSDYVGIEETFSDLLSDQDESAVLLKGLRTREGLSQIEFSKLIGVSQQNLSAMENGRRSIGKVLAKRIADQFDIDYRLLL